MVKPGTDDVLTVLGILGNITSMGLFLSPMPTFYKICKAKSTGQYSALPYVATLLNCMLWTFYGSGAVSGLIFVVSINVAGLIMEGCYVTIHLLFGSHNSRKTVSILLAVISILYGALVSVVLVVVKSKDSRAEVVGSVCVIIGVLMYAAPLSVMKEVIRSQSVASMPFLLSFACFCNGLIWTSYGIIKENLFIYIPNGLGTLLTIAQLVLWCFYYKKGVRKSSERDTANLSGHHAVDVEKLTKQPSAGARLDLSADSDLNRESKKGFNENDTALMALCRDV
jgi:solute carrier family 50 protein (sugar transporter)